MSEVRQPEHSLDWNELLETALTVPGRMGDAYTRLTDYSYLNQLLLVSQGCPIEPTASFQRWKEFGRYVKRGAKAYTIIRPITVKTKEIDPKTGEPKPLTRFKAVKGAFPVSMTEGDDLPEYEPPGWNVERALGNLAINRVPYVSFSGSMQGYSYENNVAVSPVAKYPFKTLIHECGHVVCGHTAALAAGEDLHRGIAEVQAEGTAYLALHELGAEDQMDAAASRAYIKNWRGETQPDEVAIRGLFAATNKILRAGRAERQAA